MNSVCLLLDPAIAMGVGLFAYFVICGYICANHKNLAIAIAIALPFVKSIYHEDESHIFYAL